MVHNEGQGSTHGLFWRLIGIGLLVAWAVILPLGSSVRAQGDVDAQKKQIEELQQKLTEIQNQKQSLAQTLQYISTRVKLTQMEIDKTQSEIDLLVRQIAILGDKIGMLNVNLEKLSGVMVNRIKESYKNKVVDPVMLLLVADSFNDFFIKLKYLQVSQQHDRSVLFALEEARVNYDQQKQLKETKQQEVEKLQTKLLGQKTQLDKQQKEKQAALAVTRNDEKRYQDQLAKALAELSAIQSIVAGRGSETEVGNVNEGATIANVIVGPSACSSGSHLHFEVTKEGNHLNPAEFLSSKNIIWDDGPDGPFSLSGSWRWPINDPIRITQGYGMTFYATTLRYYGGQPHTGMDMISDGGNMSVLAVKNGKLFRGAIACGGGSLRYVHVDQGDGVSSYYLHVNY